MNANTEINDIKKLSPGAQKILASTAQRFLNSPAPEMDFVIPDILPARIVSVLAAPGGDGKGLLGIQAGITISSGLPFLGLPETATEPQKVMFISAEDNTDELHRRYLDIATSLSVTREIDDQIHDQARNMIIVGDDECQPLLRKKGGDIVESDYYSDLIDAARFYRPRLIILDTFSTLFAGVSENDQGETAMVISETKKIARAAGATILIIHHCNKAIFNVLDGGKSKNGEKKERAIGDIDDSELINSMRGSTAIANNARLVFFLFNQHLIIAKANGIKKRRIPLYREGRFWTAAMMAETAEDEERQAPRQTDFIDPAPVAAKRRGPKPKAQKEGEDAYALP